MSGIRVVTRDWNSWVLQLSDREKMEKIRNLLKMCELVNDQVGDLAANTDSLAAVLSNINESVERLRAGLPRFIALEVSFDSDDRFHAVL